MEKSSQVEIRGSVTDSLRSVLGVVYCIARNFGKVFNLANWRFWEKSPNLKPVNIISYTIALCRSACNRQINNSQMYSDDWFAKFNAHPYMLCYVSFTEESKSQDCWEFLHVHTFCTRLSFPLRKRVWVWGYYAYLLLECTCNNCLVNVTIQQYAQCTCSKI